MKRFIAIIMLLLGGLIPFLLAMNNAALFEGWYPPWSRWCSHAIARVTSIVPFPISELFFAALAFAVPVYWIVTIVKTKKFLRALQNTLLLVSAMGFLFVWLWGINYFCRSPVDDMGITAAPASLDDLIKTAEYYRDLMNGFPEIPEKTFDQLAESVVQGYNGLAAKYDFVVSDPAPPKRLMFGFIQSYLGISGVYLPWTGEGCVVGDTPRSNLPATMAHELAHRQGAAPEDEASFLGIMACLESDDMAVRYSGAYFAFIYLSNDVHSQSPEAHGKLWDGLSERCLNDLTALNKHYEKYEGPINDIGDAVNDAYLKAMQQPDGLMSYGRVTDLLIADLKLKK